MRDIDTYLPVNKLAKFVVSKNREHGSRFYCKDVICSMAPLPFKGHNGPAEHDLTGRRVGRFVVLGVALFLAGKKRERRWVVKCVCGRYQMLSAKAIKKKHDFMACVECNKTNHLRVLSSGING
jgi:hypothetical protein